MYEQYKDGNSFKRNCDAVLVGDLLKKKLGLLTVGKEPMLETSAHDLFLNFLPWKILNYQPSVDKLNAHHLNSS